MITHHPAAEMLCEYAAGATPEGVALVIATHLALCPRCRRQVRRLEAIGGVLLADVDPVAVDEDALSRTLARLDDPEPPSARPLPPLDPETLATIPSPLHRYLAGSLSALPWKPVGRMFHEVRLSLTDTTVKATLMRMGPGHRLPKHTHRGHEYTVVLAGGFRDGAETFVRGDFAAKDRTDRHRPRVNDDENEECLALVVLDAPVRLTGLLGRLINPFLRF